MKPSPMCGQTAAEWIDGEFAALGVLGEFVSLAAERLLLARTVAAAKFGTRRPIDDPDREQQLLDQVVTLFIPMEVDPGMAARFFGDQIEANKIVQRALHASWAASPALRPAHRPDLDTEVRPELDRITRELLQRLPDVVRYQQRNAEAGQLLPPRLSARMAGRLDRLHRYALAVALSSLPALSKEMADSAD